MKYKILLLSLSLSTCYACEIKNNEYIINLSYHDGVISSQIKNNNDNNDFKLLNSTYKIGFEIKDYHYTEIKEDKRYMWDNYRYMTIGNGNYFSNYLNNNSKGERIILPFPTTYFSTHKSVNDNLELDKFISDFRKMQETENNNAKKLRSYDPSKDLDLLPFGTVILIPKVKVILDPEIKTCIDFTGQPFKYNLGNKYVYKFNIWWDNLKIKVKQTYKAAIE